MVGQVAQARLKFIATFHAFHFCTLMKSFLLFAPVGLLALACQPQAQHQPAESAQPPVAVVAGAAAEPTKPIAAVGVRPIGSLSPDMLGVLRASDLTDLLRTTHDDGGDVLNGFFGPDHYRIAFVVTDVRRDPARPDVYYLQGQDQYKGRVTPFAGTFTIRQFGEQPFYTARELAKSAEENWALTNKPNYYTTTGDFVLREDSSRHGAGVFTGQLALDWHREDYHSPTLECRNDQGFSRGGLIKYEGTWTNYQTQRATPVVWVRDLLTYNAAKEVLADFNVGERGIEVNPKYARLGWNEYWENDEWWADSKAQTKASANTSAEAADTILSLDI